MKKRIFLRRVEAVMLALVLCFTIPLPSGYVSTNEVKADEESGDKNKPVATDVHYYPNDDVPITERTGIKSFTLSPYIYYNMSKDSDVNPSGEDTIKLSDEALKRIAVHKIFPKWSIIADKVFRDEADQIVTIEGTGMMKPSGSDSESFDRHFNTNRPGVKGYSYDWTVSDLSEELRRDDYKHKGELCWDEVRTEGISQISSLADARRMMGQSLRNCSDDDNLSVDDFLGNEKQKTSSEYRLPDMDDDTERDGFCNIVGKLTVEL